MRRPSGSRTGDDAQASRRRRWILRTTALSATLALAACCDMGGSGGMMGGRNGMMGDRNGAMGGCAMHGSMMGSGGGMTNCCSSTGTDSDAGMSPCCEMHADMHADTTGSGGMTRGCPMGETGGGHAPGDEGADEEGDETGRR